MRSVMLDTQCVYSTVEVCVCVLCVVLCVRSYGRAPKMIYLEANFVQFKEDLLPKEGNKALLTFPFLHIYWTDCCVSSPLGIMGNKA